MLAGIMDYTGILLKGSLKPVTGNQVIFYYSKGFNHPMQLFIFSDAYLAYISFYTITAPI